MEIDGDGMAREASVNEDELPEMMFAPGEEPVGVRVLTYQSSRALKRILNVLEEDEIQIIRESSFGKLIEIADKPSFSGRFARYVMSRQFKVNKKHEAWFRFAGKPIRFSMREFAIVTGLPCGIYPAKSKLKMKKNISEKPYWPELFGKVETVAVSSVIKMLRRKTVKETDIRVKYACLAILSSVLLSTNLKMKISREHAEAIEDIEEFFSYPWGRAAFEMLMGSIKERDEVSLSQNNIAVKGFALALQLVMVEAVPALTDVVQDTFSSTESDSDDEMDDGSERRNRKQTLSPSHARGIDKKGEVSVTSILPDDPNIPLNEETLVWSDEETDKKVDNMIRLVMSKHEFKAEMFKGGATKADVERLREADKGKARQRKRKKSTGKQVCGDGNHGQTVSMETLKPQIERIEARQNSTDTTLKEICGRLTNMENSRGGSSDEVLVKIKEDVVSSIAIMVKQLVSELVTKQTTGIGEETRAPMTTPTINPEKGGCVSPGAELCKKTIENVLQNLSEYSTPGKDGTRRWDNETPGEKGDVVSTGGNAESQKNGATMSAQSHNQHPRWSNMNQEVEDAPFTGPVTEIPSFGLGLTQEEAKEATEEEVDKDGDIHEDDENVDDNIGERKGCRRGKRQKTIPNALLTDYHCGPQLLSRVREAQKLVFASHEASTNMAKYLKLEEKLENRIVVNVAGLVVSGKEIKEIADRVREPTPRIVDIMMRILRAVVEKETSTVKSQICGFVDSKFIGALSKGYSRFSKAKSKSEYEFSNTVVGYFSEKSMGPSDPSRYYLPVYKDNGKWVGVCVDCEAWKVVMFEGDTCETSDAYMSKVLKPVCEMFPYLLRKTGRAPAGGIVTKMGLERVEGIEKDVPVNDSAIMASVLMGVHALYGDEACKGIVAEGLSEEAKAAAVTTYEFYEKL